MYITPHGRRQVHMKECWKTTDVRDAATLELRTHVVSVSVCCVFLWCAHVCRSCPHSHTESHTRRKKRKTQPLPHRAEYFLLPYWIRIQVTHGPQPFFFSHTRDLRSTPAAGADLGLARVESVQKRPRHRFLSRAARPVPRGHLRLLACSAPRCSCSCCPRG